MKESKQTFILKEELNSEILLRQDQFKHLTENIK